MMQTATPFNFKVSENNPFIVGESDLDYFLDRPRRLNGGGIFLCFSGEAEISVNMKRSTIKKNMQVILLPNDLLMIIRKDDHFRILYLIFNDELFEEASFRMGSDYFGFLRDNFCALLPAEAIKNNCHTFYLMEDLYKDQENRFRNKIAVNYIQNYLLNSYDKIFRFHTQKEIKESDRQNELFKKFVTLVDSNCTKIREVTFYANELSISTRYLTTIVQKNAQLSAKAFIDNCVILEIKLSLHTSELTIQQIADRMGFPDQSYLGRYFKKQTGMSPKQYRKRPSSFR
ncbi:helix-turn-helix domain-containing protein [Parabacteroides sp. PF5-9]|uniref:helix-turn-helix domain-containing protein n=1 Tax=Parabacteroides sp. PF5-9 TaxID=1742404 RepID=UPI002473D73E|nr:helix-turn-helix domain-containing protein [Parabacteroides sp. PF5-9]MDH6359228.1 AraC family transcriptional activator of pobA [Parabacteroides sp. PF5-9]